MKTGTREPKSGNPAKIGLQEENQGHIRNQRPN